MLAKGEVVSLFIEKPAAGGSMIAYAGGQVVLVAGAIPGERVRARINRLAKHLAYADTIEIEEQSNDRRDFFGDRLCGGCLYGHITYPRQLLLKSEVIVDAFARIARIPLTEPISVAPSPEEGYRMRARAHVRDSGWGFFREGTHDVCDARQTRQLLPATCDALDRVVAAARSLDAAEYAEIELAENVDASERVVFLDYRAVASRSTPGLSDLSSFVADAAKIDGLTGFVARFDVGRRPITAAHGSAHVTDTIALPGNMTVALRRHVLSFFQGNRFLIAGLVADVLNRLPQGGELLDLYAGVGLFSISAAAARGVRATAVEGDRYASADLVANAAAVSGAVTAVHQAVEGFSGSGISPRTIVVDPPRTGMSREAMEILLGLGAPTVVYVSCDVATLARDARRLSDSGYVVGQVAGFDLYPNTPHVETVVTFNR
jgi:23S rRNA (uracil1939-C5)-methyltransferase